MKNFLILVKCPRDSRKKSDWFRCEKISQKLKYLNFKCEQSERYFSSCSIRFTTLRMSMRKISQATSEKRKWKSGFTQHNYGTKILFIFIVSRFWSWVRKMVFVSTE